MRPVFFRFDSHLGCRRAIAFTNRPSPHCRDLDIWETTYLHLLEGADPVLEWLKGTALRPLLAALDEADRPAFEAACAARLRQAYSPVNWH